MITVEMGKFLSILLGAKLLAIMGARRCNGKSLSFQKSYCCLRKIENFDKLKFFINELGGKNVQQLTTPQGSNAFDISRSYFHIR